MWIPTFLTLPFSLPSLPSISLPASIQRRFLSYVLKRALGRFVKAGGLDVDRIQAQLGEGWVEIEGLEVDTEVRVARIRIQLGTDARSTHPVVQH